MDEGEECDDGNPEDADACTNACKLAACGDGIVGPGELCDDGNTVDDDACTNACNSPACGDAILQMGEACDDGNAADTDACTTACKSAVCGDSLVHMGVEQCDDGNMVETDMCINTCMTAKCGDAKVLAGVEECDDGNMIDNDACTNACKNAIKKTFSGMFTTAMGGQDHCPAWNAFRASIAGGGYTKITMRGSNDMVGRVCNGANADTLCQNLKNGLASATLCDGFTWRIGNCGAGVELTTASALCQCEVTHSVRPCIGGGNPNWGGMNTATCNGPSQTLEVICE
jgi:cysteine-rich repeat protein